MLAIDPVPSLFVERGLEMSSRLKGTNCVVCGFVRSLAAPASDIGAMWTCWDRLARSFDWKDVVSMFLAPQRMPFRRMLLQRIWPVAGITPI